VDPDLGAVARIQLPEPGSFGKRVAGVEPERVVPARSVHRPSNASNGWGPTLLRTLAAASLALNGVWLAQTVGHANRAASEPLSSPPLRAGVSDDLTTTVVLQGLTTPRRPNGGAKSSEQVAQRNHPLTATGKTRVTDRRAERLSAPVRRSAKPGVAQKPATSHHDTRTSHALRWTTIAGATYYNVVLWRDGKRVLDLWPSSPQVAVPSSFVHHGSRIRLSPGRYLWFVYPGFGAKASQRYGELAGTGVLVIRPKGGK
jgi:hypothetical protein